MAFNISRKYTAADHGDIMPANAVKFIVLHHTAGHEGGDIPTLINRDARYVSCHFYVTQEGEVYQFLNMNLVAWHAGESRYDGIIGLNRCSIGIELENYGNGTDPFTVIQLEKLDQLIAYIDASFGRKLKIVGHKDVAWPRGRKSDPANNFPLDAYKAYRRHTRPAVVTTPKPVFMQTHPCHDPKTAPVLKLGAHSASVSHLQRDLNRKGARLKVDGDFGTLTKNAVMKFQEKKKLTKDGIVGPNTWKALL